MKRILLFVTAILVLVIAGGTYYVVGGHYREVIPGKAYRGAQMDGERLKQVVREHDIRTVINLRPIREDSGWYEEEVAAVEELGIELYTAGLSQTTPRVDNIRQLRAVMEEAEWPILFHCGSGVDRTGLASAMLLLLEGELSPQQVERQVSWRHGAIFPDSTGRLFLSQYREWLAQTGRTHTPDVFDEWLANDYVDPSGNFHFYIHPIREQVWGRPLGLYDEGFEFEVSRSASPILHMDGWAFDTNELRPLAGISFTLGGIPMVAAEYGHHFPWLIEDFGNEDLLYTGWSIDQPLDPIPDGCHDLRITFERLDGSRWQTPPAARICVAP